MKDFFGRSGAHGIDGLMSDLFGKNGILVSIAGGCGNPDRRVCGESSDHQLHAEYLSAEEMLSKVDESLARKRTIILEDIIKTQVEEVKEFQIRLKKTQKGLDAEREVSKDRRQTIKDLMADYREMEIAHAQKIENKDRKIIAAKNGTAIVVNKLRTANQNVTAYEITTGEAIELLTVILETKGPQKKDNIQAVLDVLLRPGAFAVDETADVADEKITETVDVTEKASA